MVGRSQSSSLCHVDRREKRATPYHGMNKDLDSSKHDPVHAGMSEELQYSTSMTGLAVLRGEFHPFWRRSV